MIFTFSMRGMYFSPLGEKYQKSRRDTVSDSACAAESIVHTPQKVLQCSPRSHRSPFGVRE